MTDGSIAILGAGAIGGYVGAMLHRAGRSVALIDHWPEHVEAVRERGLRIEGVEETIVENPPIFHLAEMQAVRSRSPSLAILSVKLYDTEWAASLLHTYLDRGVPVVTLQNALVEETVARAVGWQRVLGGIATGMNVQLVEPAHIRRMTGRYSGAPVFKIGEMSGRYTPRVRAVAELLSIVDTAVVTTDLWNDRWLKLSINSMVSPLGALSDLSLDQVLSRPDTRRIVTALGAECFLVGQALGFSPPPIFRLRDDVWIAAASGDDSARAEVDAALAREAAKVISGFVSGTGQDIRRGRKSEVDFFNGYVASRGRECGLNAGTHEAVNRVVHEIEAGRATPGVDRLNMLGGFFEAGLEV